MPKRVLLTGAGGFIGHHVLEHLLVTTGWDIVATDSFRHKGTTDRIAHLLEPEPAWRSRVTVITHDLVAPFTARLAERIGPLDYVIAMASESHVNRSIDDPVTFTLNNVSVILSTLELCRTVQPEHVIVISTDEVYGATGADQLPGHKEWAPMLPSNPYAGSKAAQEAIAISYWRTYGLPITITNTMNLFGERQDGEKFIPMLIRRISAQQEVTVHGTSKEIGTRHWLHARNLADALVHIFTKLPAMRYPAADRPDRYNIASADRVSNLELAQQIANITGHPLWYKLVGFDQARPGHDAHYALDPSKLAGTGWKPPVGFTESLERTVRWTLLHPEWME